MSKLCSVILVTILVLLASYDNASSQTATLAGGGDLAGYGGTCSYSLGQTAFHSISGFDGVVYEGVQQPYEIFVITDIDDFAIIDVECNVYPNPTTDFLTISIINKEVSGLSYQLINTNGRLLEENPILDSKTKISMMTYTPSAYFLQLVEGQNIIKSFKIIKH